MGDDFSRREGPHTARVGEGLTSGPPREKASGIEVAGACGVDEVGGDSSHADPTTISSEDHRTELGTGEARDGHMTDDLRHGYFEIVGLVERADLCLVGEQDVDIAGDQTKELITMSIDAEAVGEGERDSRPCLTGGGNGGPDDVLGTRIVPEVSLDIEHLG